MSARDNILARIRGRQGRGAPAEAEREAVRASLALPARHARPRADPDPLARFCAEAERLASTVERIDTIDAAPVAVARYLVRHGLPRQAVCWAALADLDWRAQGIGIAVREARETDLVGITGACCAIAETGTLMTVSGRDTPSTVSLLPETHIAIVCAGRVVNGMEEAWQLMRAELGVPPRAVHFISGPSRSADIEQTVTLGAHGPARVHIVLVSAGW
jgi:L-lactate dehydrogenase complex protein LldG